MTSQSFADMHGFISDPFASTNSDDEDILEEYFVAPPYFRSVLGDPIAPKSCVIFAPRGSGKTAQRRMIEVECMDKEMPFVCITYDSFEVSGSAKLSLVDHHKALCRLLTVTILEYLDREPKQADDLSDHQKRVVKVAAETFAGSLTTSEYHTAFAAVKSLGERAVEFWHQYGGVIAAGITVAMKKAGLDDVSIPAQLRAQAETFDASARYFYEQLVDIIVGPLRGGSVYILVDKVDETSATTSDPSAAWDLIRDLLLDLPTLEKKGVGFKVFLWDQLRPYFRDASARADRLQLALLEGWDYPQLSEMLGRRLRAYSERKVASFDDLLEPSIGISGHTLIARLAHGSPREMIRMGEVIASEHTRVITEKHAISRNELYSGIRKYASSRAEELLGADLSVFREIGRTSFTRKQLMASSSVKSKGDAKAKIDQWMTAGIIAEVGEQIRGNGQTRAVYGVTDARLVITLHSHRPLEDVLNERLFVCNNCDWTLVLEDSSGTCSHCISRIEKAHLVSLGQEISSS